MSIDENTKENENMNNEENEEEVQTDQDQEVAADEVEPQRDYKKEYDELYDRYIRLAADFDNYKKRTAKEKSDISAYGNEELIKSILDVVDNLERALVHSETSENNGSLLEGVKLVYNQLLNCLERFGLEKIESEKGTEFNPRYHQAFERVETDEISPGLILSEMVKGYKLKDRLLRPAIVSVAVEPSPEKQDNDESSSNNAEDSADEIKINRLEEQEKESTGYIDLTDEDYTE